MPLPVVVFLLVELLDELAGGAREAAWPFIRREFSLSYLQIGFLIGAPAILSALVEPFLGVLADVRKRRSLVGAGGIIFCVSLFLSAASTGFWLLLLSFVLFYPASGLFVSLSQAELMDRDPARKEKNMARWTFAGSAGAVVGPLSLGGAAGIGLGWRGLYLSVAILSVLALVLTLRRAFPSTGHEARGDTAEDTLSLRDGLLGALRALGRGDVLRWLALLEAANLMLDVLFGFLALYFVEVAGFRPEQAALAVTVWTAAQVVGDLLLIPLLDKVDGPGYLRASAGMVAVLFPCFLLAGSSAVKLIFIGLIGLLRAGWYAILQARLNACLPGRSGIALAVGNLAGSVGALIPLGLGALAELAGLRVAMWALLAAPLALLVGVRRLRGLPPKETS